MNSKILILFLALLLSISVYSREYFVSKNGNDANPGTKQQPFLTIQKAASVMQAGDVCYISAGVYPETIRPGQSGTAEQPIVFKTVAPDEKVIVTGADPIAAAKWKKVDSHIFKAEVKIILDHENQIFLGSKTMVEARWPNVGDDLLSPGLSVMDEGTAPEQIVDADMPDYNYEGAHVWIHAPKYWSDWTTKIERQINRNTLQIENIAPYAGPNQHVAAPGADYFIFGCRDALDAENEWFYDEDEKALYIYRENGKLPEERYLVKRRMNAFSFSDIQHIEVSGITIIGSTIETNQNTKSVLLDRMKIFYPYYSSQSNNYFGDQTDKGVLLQGKNCTIKNSEVAYSSACGVMLGGENNKVLNCYIHDTDFIGSYASCVQLGGKENVVSHCTLTRTGRSVIDYGDMYRALVQYCDMSHAGQLTSDLGLTYGNVIEGGNSEFRYNLLHENDATHLNMGLYYDHGTQNIISHHNIIWGITFSAFHLNHYAAYHLVYNNTFISDENGFLSTWGNEYEPDLLHCRWVNNIFSGRTETTAGNYFWKNNISGFSGFDKEHPFNFSSEHAGQGEYLQGISVAEKPAIGAVEYPGMAFKAGHDFENPPEMDFTRSKPLHRNRIKNSAFEHENHLEPWKKAHGKIILREHPGKIHTTPDTAIGRMGSYSVELTGEGSEIAQNITGLEPGEYTFTGHLRVPWGESAVLGVRYPDGREFLSPQVTYGSPNWRRSHVMFTVPEKSGTVEVFIRRLSGGDGNIFADDFGVVMR